MHITRSRRQGQNFKVNNLVDGLHIVIFGCIYCCFALFISILSIEAVKQLDVEPVVVLGYAYVISWLFGITFLPLCLHSYFTSPLFDILE